MNPSRGTKRLKRLGFSRISLFMAFCSLAFAARAQSVSTNFLLNDFLLVPVRVHLLSAKYLPEIGTTLTEKDVTRIFMKANRIWAPAGVQFFVESLVKEQAAHQEYQSQLFNFGDRFALESLRPEQSRATNMVHVYFIKTMVMNGIYFPEAIFVKDTAKLRMVQGGLDEPLPRVTAHELGHALGLGHRQNETNLMASGTTGFSLNAVEIEKARETARAKEWIRSVPALMNRAKELWRKRKFSEATRIYSAVLSLPVQGRATELARQRLGQGRGTLKAPSRQ